ncbi:MAG: ATP-binding cassette domain-containing protein [Pseudomonadota bacterium]|nr:ATP-binding cassette domain-containing protein [Pseudomonadota bacterium]
MIALWTRLGRPYKGRIALALLLAGAGGIMAALLLGISGWFLTASALAGAAGAGQAFNHLYPSATVRGTAMGRILARYGEQLVGHDATLRVSARLRRNLFETTARARCGLARPDADSLSVFLDDVKESEAALLRLWLPLVSAVCAALVALAFAALTGTGALAAVAAGFFLTALVGRFGLAEQRRIDRRLQTLSDAYRRQAASLVEDRIELEALDRFGAAADALAALAGDTARETLRAGRRARIVSAATAITGGLSAIAAIALDRDAGTALLAGTALSVLAAHQAVAMTLGAWMTWPRTELALQRIGNRLSAPPAIADPEPAPPPAAILPVEADNLVFGPDADHPLASVGTLILERGSVTEITGPSGAGKTTLLETLARLRPPLGGELYYGGTAAGSLRSAAVRQRVGFAPQLPDTMAGSVRDALRLAQPDADDARMIAACDTAAFWPGGRRGNDRLDLVLEDGGANLSGGELRRLAIARAVLRDPDLLLLDEPFAGLDGPVRAALGRNLAAWALRHDAAIVVVTHAPDAALWPGLIQARIDLAP